MSLMKSRSSSKCWATLALCGLLLPGCARLHRVVPLADAKTGEYVYYALPQTVVVVTLTGVVTTVDPKPTCEGEAALMMELGLKAPVYSGKLFSIEKVEVSHRAEPDPTKIYAVEVTGGFARTLGLETSAVGLPSLASSKAQDVVLPAAVEAVKLAAKLASIVAFGDVKQVEAKACSDIKKNLQDVRTRLLDLDSSPGAADPKEILEFKQTSLRALAKQLEAAFTGVSPGEPKKIVCEIRPVKGTQAFPLLKWTMKGGVTSTPDANVECQVPPDLVVDGAATARDTATPAARDKLTVEHVLALQVAPTGRDVAAVTVPAGRREQRSFYFRRPASARVWVSDSLPKTTERRLTETYDWTIAQLGEVDSLPRLSSGGSIEVQVTFDPSTGALLKVGATRSSADLAKAVGAIDTASSTLHDAEKVELERTKAILEAQVAIKAAEEALENE